MYAFRKLGVLWDYLMGIIMQRFNRFSNNHVHDYFLALVRYAVLIRIGTSHPPSNLYLTRSTEIPNSGQKCNKNSVHPITVFLCFLWFPSVLIQIVSLPLDKVPFQCKYYLRLYKQTLSPILIPFPPTLMLSSSPESYGAIDSNCVSKKDLFLFPRKK